MLAVRLRWVSITHLGSPVVPEVNINFGEIVGLNGDRFGGGEVGYGQLQLFEAYLRHAEVDISFGCEAGGEGELGLGAGI